MSASTIRVTALLRAMAGTGMLLAATGSLAHSDDSNNVLYAANDGVDSNTCGPRSDPCRSINETIAHASDGALIIVGPGRYGDLNHDGELTEEHPDPSCRCLFDINKRLTIISSAGAAQTILDAGNVFMDLNVRVAASGAVFGSELRGFTVLTSTPNPPFATARVGIRIEFSDRTVVAGNTVERHAVSGIWIVNGTGHRIRGNISAYHGNGITVNTGGNFITGNSVYGNRLRGLSIAGRNNVISFNASVGNDFGMQLEGPGHVVFRNSFLGNRQAGVSLVSSTPNDVRLTHNNFFGNGVAPQGSPANCGVVLSSQTSSPLDARNNYWGSATGPGADPADALCNLAPPSVVLTQPFAKKEFHISMLW